ncbi:hypothetical protein ACFLVJ_00800 [Chloroflexota bacterium]
MKFKAVIVIAFVTIFLGLTTTTVLSQGELPSDYDGLKNQFLTNNAPTLEAGYGELFNSQHEVGVLPDCFRCHTKVLQGHDKLGSGTEACLTCHSSTHMGSFHLFDDTEISKEDSHQLCGQCHAARYDAWQTGLHGVITGSKGSTLKPKCIDCHESHQPSMSLVVGKTLPPLEPSADSKLDCLNCHVRVLRGHDKLGSGSEACWSCHVSTHMNMLHLAGGETLLLTDAVRLCAQCHQDRHEAWTQGTHGVPAWTEGEAALLGVKEVTCVNCHEPHQPQLALLNITKSPPMPTPSPPSPQIDLLLIAGIILLVTTGTGVVILMRGEG